MNAKITPHTIELDKDIDINSGEYNITPITFEFSDEYEGLTKEAIFSTCSTSIKTAILNNQCIIPTEVLQEPGNVLLGVYAYSLEDDELVLRYSPKPIYFNVKNGSYKEGFDPDLPSPSVWEQVLEQINTAIEETNNLNIEADKDGHITTITITHKDGTEQTIQVEDGKDLEFNWRGTELGVRQEGQSEYEYVNLQGQKGEPGAIKMQIVNVLPEVGQDDTIYLVPLEQPDIQGNNYAEYIWVNNAWELLGKIGVQVDLTDYVKNTDYATSSVAGVIKVTSGAGLEMGSSGVMRGTTVTYANYPSMANYGVISKGTLENVITGKGFEVTSNKVTSLSSASTDTQYPSAKCVYDLIGDLETILTTLDIGGGV